MANLKQIQKYLIKKQLPHKVVDLGGKVFTVEGVKETGVSEDEIVKTLIVRISGSGENKRNLTKIERSSKNGQFIALAVRGKDRVDFKKVRRLFGSKSELAKKGEVEKVTGVPVGAVCPIFLEVPLHFDERVMSLKHVNMGSGDLKYGLEMEFEDLLKAVGKYEIGDLV